MCYLRGMVFKNLNNIERAKECFQEALKVDVKCYDALDCLISNNMLTVKEGNRRGSEAANNKTSLCTTLRG